MEVIPENATPENFPNADKTHLISAISILADTARDHEDQRAWLGELYITPLAFYIQQCSVVSEDVETPFLTSLFRALANLVADCDENRQRLLQTDVLSGLLAIWKITKEDRTQFLLGVLLLNLTMDHEEAQEAVVLSGFVPLICEYAKHCPHDILSNVGVLLENLVTERGTGAQQIQESGLINDLCQHLSSSLEGKVDFFETLTASKSNIPLFKETFIDLCLDFLSRNYDNATLKKELNHLALVLASQASIDLYLQFYMRETVVNTLLHWISSATGPDYIKTAAVLILGNIARTDANCVVLGKQGAIEKLIGALSIADTIGYKVALLGCLKNLSIPVANKMLMTQSHLILTLVPHIQSSIPEIQLNALVILKNLTKGMDNARLVTELKVPVDGEQKEVSLAQQLVDICKNTKEEGVFCEGTRVLVNISIASVDSRSTLVETGSLALFAKLLGSKHMILKAEALLALTVLASTGHLSAMYQDVETSRSIASSVTGLLDNQEAPADILSNVCVLIHHFVQDRLQSHVFLAEYETAWLRRVLEVHEKAKTQISDRDRVDSMQSKLWISLVESSLAAKSALEGFLNNKFQ